MSAEVVEYPGITKLDLPAEKILSRAIDADLEDVLIIGWEKDETLYAASTTANVGKLLHLIETFKHKLIAGDFEA
jgi:hypothetical protein